VKDLARLKDSATALRCSPALTQYELLNLAGGGLRQVVHRREAVWRLEVRQMLPAEGAQFGGRGLNARAKDHERMGRLAPLLVEKPTTAASCTAGCRSRVHSTSTEEMFSPPLMMTSFNRSRISM
jgi:hypothetical protein